MTKSKELIQAEDNLRKYLKEKPHLQEYQNEIDHLMKKAGDDFINRMAVLKWLIADRSEALNEALSELQDTVENIDINEE